MCGYCGLLFRGLIEKIGSGCFREQNGRAVNYFVGE